MTKKKLAESALGLAADALAAAIFKEINHPDQSKHLNKDNYCTFYQGTCWSTPDSCKNCKYFPITK